MIDLSARSFEINSVNVSRRSLKRPKEGKEEIRSLYSCHSIGLPSFTGHTSRLATIWRNRFVQSYIFLLLLLLLLLLLPVPPIPRTTAVLLLSYLVQGYQFRDS